MTDGKHLGPPEEDPGGLSAAAAERVADAGADQATQRRLLEKIDRPEKRPNQDRDQFGSDWRRRICGVKSAYDRAGARNENTELILSMMLLLLNTAGGPYRIMADERRGCESGCKYRRERNDASDEAPDADSPTLP